LFFIETNFYGDGGSKLSAIAGEYTAIYEKWTSDGHQFIWITDGFGWKKTKLPLRDTFDATDYILNLYMVQKGALEGIIKQMLNQKLKCYILAKVKLIHCVWV